MPTPIPTIDPLPDPPTTSDVTNFETDAETFVAALGPLVTQTNAATAGIAVVAGECEDVLAETISEGADAVAAAQAAAAGTMVGTSTTSITIGTGSKGPFTTQANKNWGLGSGVVIASSAAPATNRMEAVVTAYSGTSLTVDVSAIDGSGAHTDWVISLAGTPGLAGDDGAPGAVNADVQEFTSSGTWTKPDGCTNVIIELWGAGGGGASGSRGAAGTGRFSGAGGGGGSYSTMFANMSDMYSTISVTIGAGGDGGAARTADDTAGIAGTDGGDTFFWPWLTAYGGKTSATPPNEGGFGGRSFGGTTSTGNAGGDDPTTTTSTNGKNVMFAGAPGGSGANASTAYLPGQSMSGGQGGGAGGGISSTNTLNAGTDGGSGMMFGEDGTAGTSGSRPGVAGTGFKGGGGGYPGNTGGTVAGGVGGAGGTASGGGGGGSSTNGANSGAGGAGGDGFARITSW